VNGRTLAATAVFVATVVAAGVLVAPGALFGSGLPDGSADNETTPTATVTPDAPTSTETGTATAAERPFGFTVDRIEECGRTCRDVTATVTNQQSTEASDVTVETRIYAGNGTDGDPVWTGERAIGDLAAGESATNTTRVDLGLSDAVAIESEDGWITIETTVSSDGETMTITERRQVA
jgi:hypothetical protein